MWLHLKPRRGNCTRSRDPIYVWKWTVVVSVSCVRVPGDRFYNVMKAERESEWGIEKDTCAIPIICKIRGQKVFRRDICAIGAPRAIVRSRWVGHLHIWAKSHFLKGTFSVGPLFIQANLLEYGSKVRRNLVIRWKKTRAWRAILVKRICFGEGVLCPLVKTTIFQTNLCVELAL